MPEEELDEVYGQHLVPVWRFVRARVPGHADAEELTNETFARAVAAWRRYDERRGSVAAWLLGIARHVVADWWRRRPSEVSWEELGPESDPRSAAGEPDPAAAVLDQAERDELRSQLGRLTDREREAVALRFGAGLKATEVAAALGVSDAAARMLVHRAVSKLRAVMSHE